MKQISWYRSIRFRIPAVIALVLLVPIVVFWHYSMELTRKNMLSQTSNLIYTNLYGASLLMDDVMEQGDQSGPRLSLSDLPIPAGRCRF